MELQALPVVYAITQCVPGFIPEEQYGEGQGRGELKGWQTLDDAREGDPADRVGEVCVAVASEGLICWYIAMNSRTVTNHPAEPQELVQRP